MRGPNVQEKCFIHYQIKSNFICIPQNHKVSHWALRKLCRCDIPSPYTLESGEEKLKET